MKIGFTGTRQGMADMQARSLFLEFEKARPTEFHHGACIGCDAGAVKSVRAWQRMYKQNCRVVAHPGASASGDRSCRDEESTSSSDFVLPEKNHFARNRDIVNASDLLIGVSLTPHRTDRGGTWYTVDYAVKQGKPVKVIWPDGTVEDWTGPTS